MKKQSRLILSTDAVITSRCACPGDTCNFTYKCTVMGGVATLWTGSALYCRGLYNQVVLRHSHFYNEISYLCSNRSIVVRGLTVEGNSYISQLTITVAPKTAGETVMCVGHNRWNTTVQPSLMIPTTGLSSSIYCKSRIFCVKNIWCDKYSC